jgi:AcrR family transcriptional regulator
MVEKSGYSRRRAAALNDGGAEYAAKRGALIRLAAKLFKEKGYRATTLNDIASAAGMDRATLYYYFGSKEEFFQEAVQGILDDNLGEAERLVRTPGMDAREKIAGLIERLMISYERNYPQMYVYIQQDMHKVADKNTPWAKRMAVQTHRFEKAFLELLREGVKQGVFREDVPAELMANSIFGMLNWTHRWHKPGGKHTAVEIARSFCNIFFDGIAKDRT